MLLQKHSLEIFPSLWLSSQEPQRSAWLLLSFLLVSSTIFQSLLK